MKNFLPKTSTLALTAAAMLAGSALTAAAEEKVSMLIADFEQPSSTAKFIPMKDNPQKLTWVNDPKLVVAGKGSGCWYVPVAGKGEHQWPRATYNLPKDQHNWEMFDCLELEIFNPDKTESRFGINIYDSDGNAYGSHTRAVQPGRSTFVWDLPDAVRKRPILRIMLVTGNPVREYTLYIDNIRATATRESLNKRIDNQLIRLEADWQASLWQRAGMQKEFDAFKNQLLAIKNSRGDLKKSLQEFADFNRRYPAAKKELIAKLCSLTVKEFDRQYPAPAVWGYGWTDGMQKVYRQDLPYLGKVGGTAEISLAKRETEGVQLVLRSRSDLKNVKLSIGEFKNKAANAVLPASAIKSAVVGHVKTLPPPYPVEPAEWHPDPLLEYIKAFPLEKDVWQAFFLDIKTSADTPAGLYEGFVTASADGVKDLQIPVRINVWDFTLPEELSHPRVVNFNTDGNHTVYSEDEKVRAEFIRFREDKIPYEKLSDGARKLWELELVTRDMLLEHLIAPNGLYITRRRHKINEFLDWENKRGSFYNITYVPPMRVAKGQSYTPWARQMVLANLAALVPELRKHDLMKKSYLYSFDEIGDEKFFSAVEILTEIKKLYPDICTVTTAYDPDFGRTNGLDKVIDCWVPQVERFVEQLDLIREVQRSGKKVWYYSCLWDPGMDMVTEKPLTSVRLLVGLNQIRLGSDGFLYYAVNSGQYYHKPIVADTPLTEHNGRGCGKFNGEGLLIYATKAGPQPAIRLKAFRDGLEDIEYCYLLRKIPAKVMSAKDLAKREELLKVPAAVITNLEIFDQTGEALNVWRNEAGAMLQRYSKTLPKEPVKKVAVTPAAAPAAKQARVQLKADKARLQLFSYPNSNRTSEDATFYLKAFYDGKYIKSGGASVIFTDSNGKIFDRRIVYFPQNNPAKFKVAKKEPGIIIAKVEKLFDARGNEVKVYYPQAAVAVESDKILPADTMPADFMDFWQKHLARVKNSPVTVDPMPGKKYKNHNAFLLTANLPDDEKVYAVMLVPKTPGKYGVRFSIPGAGAGSAEMWPADYEKNFIIIGAHVHKYPPVTNRQAMKKALEDYENALGMPYCYENIRDKDKFFYRRVICGFNVIADYVASRSDYDGKNFQVTGSSQGGGLSLMLAGLNKNVSAVAVNVPAFCDHAGWKVNRAPGWPGFHWHQADDVAPYYDACNFAEFITAPVFMSIGHVDNITPPAGGYAAFNRLKGVKELMPMYIYGHAIPKEYHTRSEAFLKKHTR